MSSASNSLHPTSGEPLNTAAERARSLAAEARQHAQEMGQSVREATAETMDEAQACAQDYYLQGREKARQLTQATEDFIRREPGKALLIAAGVGLAVGFFIARR
jgi:ElaB/YqjD/DUF883 family membrane-anchored ribosome-binding protein